jgi:uncharacterized protein DUF5916
VLRLASLAPLTCVVTAALADAPPERAIEPTVAAGQTSSEIRLDGVLDEAAWAQAGVIADLIQQSPLPGEPTPFHTEVRVLAGERMLYLGITCTDPEPDRIALHTMQRDGDFSGDDSVAFVLDPFGDRVNGYLFRINAAGARQDGLISGSPEVSLDWDGIWDARTQRTASGWTAEIALPSITLRFDPSLPAWGLNVERYVARVRLTLRWSGTSLDASFADLRRSGALEGVQGLRHGMGLRVSPYALGRSEHQFMEDHSFQKGQAGVDVEYNITPGVAGVLTVNPDFAETEVDTRQINLTRFPLFFPEKRPFFLEGSDLFVFGLDLQEYFIPFFSRRVGLFEDEIVPISAGVKALGHSGPWSLALLDTQTRDTPAAPGTNLFAGRLTYDANSHLRFGGLATRGDPDGVSENTLGALDAVWRTSTMFGDKNFAAGGWGARSWGSTPSGRRGGWGFEVTYPNDLWNLSIQVSQFDEALDPALGFLPRPGTRQYVGGLAYQPRPEEDGAFRWARQFFYELYPTRVDDQRGDPETWRVFIAPFNVETSSGEHFEANVAPEFERLDLPFEIVPGIIIPPGRYQFTRYRVQAESSLYRSVRGGQTVWFGDFFDGRLSQWNTTVGYTTPAGHFQLEAAAENDFAHLPEGDFTERLFTLKTVYAFTPDLILSAFSQYDSETRNLGSNLRLRWTIHPGDDLFVVWNHAWERLFGPDGEVSLVPDADQLAVKLRWTFTE